MFDARKARRLIVYGGSFDPPHRAHVELPFQAAHQIHADGVLYIPAGVPPHKSHRVLTDAKHRLAMLRLALADRPAAAIRTLELDRTGPSYTVDTLEELHREFGDAVELRLLIGSDMAAIFETWRKPERIVELAEPLVMLRPGETCPLDPAWQTRIVHLPQMDISSTGLREMMSRGEWDDQTLRNAVAENVLHYIRRHGLYSVVR